MGHGSAIGSEDDALEQSVGPYTVLCAPLAWAFLQDALDAAPEVLGDDGCVLAGIGSVLAPPESYALSVQRW